MAFTGTNYKRKLYKNVLKTLYRNKQTFNEASQSDLLMRKADFVPLEGLCPSQQFLSQVGTRLVYPVKCQAVPFELVNCSKMAGIIIRVQHSTTTASHHGPH